MAAKEFIGVSEQSKAVVHRLEDAHALLREKRWRGAMYIGGYVVECQLKKKLMEKFGCPDLLQLEDELRKRKMLKKQATIFTHQLELLLRLTGGLDRLRSEKTHWAEFTLVNEWIPAWRYSARPTSKDEAEFFVQAANSTRLWIENNI